MKDHIHTHVKTMPDGRAIDVLKLQSDTSEAPVEKLPIGLIRGASRSKRTGFSLNRYIKADTRFPVIVDKDNFLIDGRHRYFKKLDKGHKDINVIRVTDAELMNHSMPTATSLARKVAKLIRL